MQSRYTPEQADFMATVLLDALSEKGPMTRIRLKFELVRKRRDYSPPIPLETVGAYVDKMIDDRVLTRVGNDEYTLV